MKTNHLVLFIVSLMLSLPTMGQNGVVIEGTIQDSNEEYALLAYSPLLRGNLNFDGFKSIGSPVDETGKFKLASEHITHGADYRLFFPQHYVPLNLFEGDRIHLDVYLKDPERTFATGKGAGKINVLNLSQFQYEFVDLAPDRSLEALAQYINERIEHRLTLLEAIYHKDHENSLVFDAPNAKYIQKIITNTPISPAEYEYLHTLVQFERYSLLTNFLARKNAEDQTDSSPIDFSSAVFKFFNPKAYRQLDHINDRRLNSAVESILPVEYLRHQQRQEGLVITYGNWRSMLATDGYGPWCSEFLKRNFNSEVFNRYYAGEATWSMTYGINCETSLSYLNLEEDNKYVNRVQAYRQLLKKGLENKTYGLAQKAKTLDEQKFNKLLSQYKNTPLLIVFWSAKAAGASLLDELPSLTAFEKDNKGKTEVVYICVDHLAHKNMWAARVIDESWQAEHYFLPIEENETTLQSLTDKDISNLCSGGATYTFIDKEGEIQKGIPAPFYLKGKEIEEVYQ